ncbi:hypothetical protein [Paracoccus fistulariae]|uniref:Uncharacterized protein n=1 Tax=Paracoccus fistulariae TaxID=658446 RepID=A0ABY7SPN1_9RHOB|nr:hypothetical protein [Paracoccus fistulariae]MDB6183059.1 hypothetical protein [Paracoccus fistulariae]WCR08853.1 hypothetical protein JHX87_08710 [Paracoccus fistulariae]
MSGLLAGGTKVAVGAAGEALLERAIDDGLSYGATFLTEYYDRSQVVDGYGGALINLPQGQGMLFAVTVLNNPDGSTFAYPPISLGTGRRPVDPLVNINISKAALAHLGLETAQSLDAGRSFTYKEMRFYWAARLPDGDVEIFRADSASLHAQQTAEIIRTSILATSASDSDSLRKLAAQADLFDTLEDRMRDELREKGLEGQLTSARAKMRDARQLYERAAADRDRALKEASDLEGLQELSSLFGLAANFGSLIGAANAKSEYAKTEMQNGANQYNLNIQTTISIYQQTTLSPNLLPEAPELILP